jgi:hypothetical protein
MNAVGGSAGDACMRRYLPARVTATNAELTGRLRDASGRIASRAVPPLAGGGGRGGPRARWSSCTRKPVQAVVALNVAAQAILALMIGGEEPDRRRRPRRTLPSQPAVFGGRPVKVGRRGAPVVRSSRSRCSCWTGSADHHSAARASCVDSIGRCATGELSPSFDPHTAPSAPVVPRLRGERDFDGNLRSGGSHAERRTKPGALLVAGATRNGCPLSGVFRSADPATVDLLEQRRLEVRLRVAEQQASHAHVHAVPTHAEMQPTAQTPPRPPRNEAAARCAGWILQRAGRT